MIGKIKQKLEKKNKILNFWNKHTFLHYTPSDQRNYLEQHKEAPGGFLYCVDCKGKALISTFCVVENCLTPPTITEEKQSKEVKMFLKHWINLLC